MTSNLTTRLSDSCQQALQELQVLRPEAEVIAVRGDWAYVSIGTIALDQISPVFKQDSALGIVRIPTNFPTGTHPYGIVTVPYLERSDGSEMSKQHRSHKKAEPVQEALGENNVGFWSWRWEDVSHNQPRCLRKAPDVIRERLRLES